MEKKIKWSLVDSRGKRIYVDAPTRAIARGYKKGLELEMFEPWNNDLKYPLYIEREEWVLLSKKVVR